MSASRPASGGGGGREIGWFAAGDAGCEDAGGLAARTSSSSICGVADLEGAGFDGVTRGGLPVTDVCSATGLNCAGDIALAAGALAVASGEPPELCSALRLR